MKEDLHPIDDLFRSGLEGGEDVPPPSVWSAVERALDAQPPAPPARPGWLKGLGGIALLAAITGAVIYGTGGKEGSTVSGETAMEQTDTASVGGRKAPDADASTRESASTTNAKPVKEKAPTATEKSPTLNNTASEETTAARRESPSPSVRTDGQPKASEKIRDRSGETAMQKPAPEKPHTRAGVISAIAPANGSAAAHGAEVQGSNATASPIKNAGNGGASSTGGEETGKPELPKAVAAGIPTETPVEKVAQQQSTLPKEPGNRAVAPATEVRREATAEAGATKTRRKPKEERPDRAANGMAAAGQAGGEGVAPALRPGKQLSRLSLMPSVSVNMTRISIERNERFGPFNREHREFRETERNRTSVMPGILAEWNISPKLSVMTGLSGLQHNIRIEPKDIKAVRDRDGEVRYRLDCSAGSYFIDTKGASVPTTGGNAPIAGDSIRILSSDIRMDYATIPLNLVLTLGGRDARFYLTGGLDVNVLVRKDARVNFSSVGKTAVPSRSEGLNRSYLNGVLGGGVDIRLGRRLSLAAMPQYRFALGPINEGNGPVRSLPKGFSLTSGLRFGL